MTAAAAGFRKHARTERITDVVIAFRIAPAGAPRQERSRAGIRPPAGRGGQRSRRVDTAAANRAKLMTCAEWQLFSAPRFGSRCRQFRTRSITTPIYRIPRNITTRIRSRSRSSPTCFIPLGSCSNGLVARPMHYLANDSPAAPVFQPVGGNDNTPPPPVPIIPDNTMEEAAAVHDTAGLVSNQVAGHDECNRDQAGGAVIRGTASAPPSSSQPALH